ncbi:MAG: L,D-transpeptidase [Anaerovoracaceae bacterium]
MEKKATKRMLPILLAVVLALTMCSTSMLANTDSAQAKASTRYWLKVNKTRNVVTAYKRMNGRWKPIRAMLCSVGKPSTPTPGGTYHMGYKQRWGPLDGCWGQYVCQITRDYLFHSVWYYTPSHGNQATAEFNKLGRAASHGCVRLAVIDAKWVYDHCRKGTKITIYKSRKAGPLGKPRRLTSSSGWDPTDPARSNPHFKLRRAVVTISKKKKRTVQYGSSYSLKSGVRAVNPNANENITPLLKYSVQIKSGTRYKKAKFSTKRVGQYRVTYTAKNGYCRKSRKKILIVRVTDSSRPTISSAANRRVNIGTANAIGSVSARQRSRSLTSRITASITAPDGTKSSLNYTQAKAYRFTQEGTYTVTYSVKNVYYAKRTASRTIRIESYINDPSQIAVDSSLKIPAGTTAAGAEKLVRSHTTVTGAGGTAITNAKHLQVSGLENVAGLTAGETVNVSLSYTDADGNTCTATAEIPVQ